MATGQHGIPLFLQSLFDSDPVETIYMVTIGIEHKPGVVTENRHKLG